VPVPRDRENDYTREAAERRRQFAEERSGASLEHVSSYSFDPAVLTGNVEQFLGVAQVPIGLAGPLLVNGEHAQGEFYVPLATAEGTLVASYNRGMRLVYEAGGVTTTIMDDRMQRAPVFRFPSAREARAFCGWVDENLEPIRDHAEATTRAGKLGIERYTAGRMVYTRFRQGHRGGLRVDRGEQRHDRALLPRVEHPADVPRGGRVGRGARSPRTQPPLRTKN
jgi:hydroxymethylglutaryl-CoA reductase (NADPH)